MSLFPAYTNSESETSAVNEDFKKEKENTDASSWLVNPSFAVKVPQFSLPKENKPDTTANSGEQHDLPVVVTNLPPSKEKEHETTDSELSEHVKNEESPECYSRKKSSKHKKHKSHHKHKQRKYDANDKDNKAFEVTGEENYYEDKVREMGNLKVTTLSRPAIPLYSVRRGRSLGEVGWINSSKKKKKKREPRYYTHLNKFCSIDVENSKEEEATTSNISMDAEENDGSIETPVDNRLEEELSKSTAQYNKGLAEQPSNVELWLKYTRFQDTVWQFEKTYRRGAGARGARVTAERKLAILDKALEHNPESDILLKERIAIAEAIFPVDTLSRQLGDMLEKQPGQLALWHGYLGATQCSLALCTVASVSKLYSQAMERLHQLRRGAPAAQTKSTEEKILALLFDCGLFLRQAGLWEQLWLLLRLYLELNMSKPESSHFKVIESTLPELLLTETEEQILASNLPLTELWLRVEKLREGAHWLPWASDEDCEDPQRLVFSDDVSDLLHPITTPSLLPNLAALILILLKVPLLPCRDTGLHVIIPHVKSWSLDSVEMLLSALFPMGTVDLNCGELLKDITKLSVGPQYLEQRLGQEHYLEFVVKVFHLCANCFPEHAGTAFCIWWFRFERLLLVLDRLGISKLPPTRRKKLKSVIKDFLKHEKNRNCLNFYREYALIEWELGHHDGACKILETAISAQPGGLPVVSIVNEQERAGLGSLYRTLSELYLCRTKFSSGDASVNKQKAVSILMALALGKPISNSESSSVPGLEHLVTVSEKYHHVGTELLENVNSDIISTLSEQLLPDFCVDWIACNAWFIFLTHSIWAAGALVEDVLKKVPASVPGLNCRREALFEVYVNLLHHHCEEAPGTYSVLRDVLHRALKEFPSNLYFLATAAKLQTCTNGIGSPWWKVRWYFTEADSLMARIFLVLLARQRYKHHQNLDMERHNFLEAAGPIVSDGSSLNLLRALFSQLEKQALTKQCPLIWRLYLRFLYDHGSEGSCKTAFYRAVEECPWVKALYIDASRLVPEEHPQIQDLIIEKELRLHVTPEELDVLRSVPF